MAGALKIRGVPYHSIEELEAATRKLCGDLVLMTEPSGERDDLARQIFEMLDALPEEIAGDITFAFQSTVQAVEVEELPEDEPDIVVDPKQGTITIDGEEKPLCPMCAGLGFLIEDPPQDPHSERCPDCAGVGKVYTGSRVPGQATRSCQTCNGNGWRLLDGHTPPPPGESGALEFPEWPGAIWNPSTLRWDPPPATEVPWENAEWNDLRGTWVAQ